jgi:23S rRNA pseudouridine955/2504/2580 synthase
MQTYFKFAIKAKMNITKPRIIQQMVNQNKVLKTRARVGYVVVSEDFHGQRIDNFLIAHLKGVPKSHIYRIVRKGEVRVNKKRISPFYRLVTGDSIRLPPVAISEKASKVPPSAQTQAYLAGRILYEDENLLIINKPSGMSVHGGSTVRIGVIEAMRMQSPKFSKLELAHRLDSETSGCLILAKKKRILRELHALLREGKIIKIYWALTKGKWDDKELEVDLPLHKDFREAGKHVVRVSHEGKASLTHFRPLKVYKEGSLVEVKLFTGRTHQIRVHAASQNHPVAGDDRYGDGSFNKLASKVGIKRLFLHARSIDFTLPSLQQHIKVVAPLDPDLEAGLSAFASL